MGRTGPAGRLADVVGVLAMATDLGLGLPTEHAIRSCLVAVDLGRRAGLGREELSDLYYLTLLRMLGCTVASDYHATVFGDEVEFGARTQHLDYGDGAAFGAWAAEFHGAGQPPEVRQHMLDRLFSYTPERRQANLQGHCEVAQMLAARLNLSAAVVEGIALVFERWDGTGAPFGVSGHELPFIVRVMALANEVEIHHRLHGTQAAVDMARARSGSAFDPDVVSLFCAAADDVAAAIEGPAVWSDVLAAEPEPHRAVGEEALAEAAHVMGDFADLKSHWFAGHAAAVADLVVAATPASVDPDQRLALRVAALAHDLGRVAVTTAIWDKPGPLDDSEQERVRLHPYYSERLLTKSASTKAAGAIAGLHHERLDGSGYHRGSGRSGQPPAARLLATADVYVALRHDRAHRAALDPDQAGAELRRLAREDLLDASAVNAVLGAVGDTGPRVRPSWPAGLTDREVDVLRRVAPGGSIAEVAADLHLAPKTVDFHLQNIYAKAGVSTRAALTLFAVQSELLI